MKKHTAKRNLRRGTEEKRRFPVGGNALVVAALVAASPTQAANFKWGETDVAFDTTISAGATVRAQDADRDSVSLGNRNFDEAGDIVSASLRATHDLDIRRGNSGFFARATYIYDPVIWNKSDIPHDARREAGRDFDMLDWFFYTRGKIGGVDTYGRIGSQVISWGESTFFTGGINTFNPVDVAKARLPGAEVKEILTPVPALLAGASLTDSLSVEAFAQLQWKRMELDPVGTFFSTTDLFGAGAREVLPPGVFKGSDNKASNTGAFGLQARYLAESLGHTNFGLYYLNYHATVPFFNFRIGPGGTMHYFADYAENIDLVGASFNTNLGDWAVQGEYSYRDNLPIAAAQIAPGNPFERYGYSQAQATGTVVLRPGVIPTTDQAAFVIEGVYNRVHDHRSHLSATEDAYAVRMMLKPEWNDAFSVPGIGVFNVVGTLDYAYGIEGIGPAAGSAIVEGSHTLGLSLEAIYQNRLSFMVSYTGNYGADDPNDRPFNPGHDRDFVQLSAKYSF